MLVFFKGFSCHSDDPTYRLCGINGCKANWNDQEPSCCRIPLCPKHMKNHNSLVEIKGNCPLDHSDTKERLLEAYLNVSKL